MWQQTEFDAYRLSQRQDLQHAHIDRLLNSVTIADRGPPSSPSASRIVVLLAAVSRRLFKPPYTTNTAAAIVPHSSR